MSDKIKITLDLENIGTASLGCEANFQSKPELIPQTAQQLATIMMHELAHALLGQETHLKMTYTATPDKEENNQ